MAKYEGRKVIITDHVYAGSSWKSSQNWWTKYNEAYFALLREFHKQIVIEVVGHDHYSDLRYHSSFDVCELSDTAEEFYFHNMFVAPGVTPIDGSNPGVAKFEITPEFVPTNLEMQFLNLNDTFGQETITYGNLHWNDFNLGSQWGV